eukprot:TRINITY_DN13945_c0_g1_i1.p1 TRINITY_DN13945_c0_g1~~TRINITY_DN13945_c0_g1_i1.p1  ORF type:complete len:526 (+),score=155.19 TRINITY_DN13945_c0_g1_i1:158-1735(+)
MADAGGGGGSKVSVQVVTKGVNGNNMVEYRIRPTMTFEQLIGAWCKRKGIPAKSVRFEHRTGEISASDTPEARCGCKAGDNLLIWAIPLPGIALGENTGTAQQEHDRTVGISMVTVEITGGSKGWKVSAKMVPTEPLQKLMKAWCRQSKLQAYFRYSGKDIDASDSCASLGWNAERGVLRLSAEAIGEPGVSMTEDALEAKVMLSQINRAEALLADSTPLSAMAKRGSGSAASSAGRAGAGAAGRGGGAGGKGKGRGRGGVPASSSSSSSSSSGDEKETQKTAHTPVKPATNKAAAAGKGVAKAGKSGASAPSKGLKRPREEANGAAAVGAQAESPAANGALLPAPAGRSSTGLPLKKKAAARATVDLDDEEDEEEDAKEEVAPAARPQARVSSGEQVEKAAAEADPAATAAAAAPAPKAAGAGRGGKQGGAGSGQRGSKRGGARAKAAAEPVVAAAAAASPPVSYAAVDEDEESQCARLEVENAALRAEVDRLKVVIENATLRAELAAVRAANARNPANLGDIE